MKNLKKQFGFIFLFFVQTSCSELVTPKDLPQEILQSIAENLNNIKDMYNFKLTCKSFNANAHYWMIDPISIQKEDTVLCTNGLIYFAKQQQTKNFELFLQNDPEERAAILTNFGWNANTKPIDAYCNLLKEAQNQSIFNEKVLGKIKLKNPCILNIQDDDGNTLFHHITKGYFNSKKFIDLRCTNINNLLEQGANPNIQDNDGYTALHRESFHYGSTNVAKKLLDGKANPNMQNINGETPLHCACNYYNIEFIKLLLKDNNINLSIQDNNGHTVLHKLCLQGLNAIPLIKLLITSPKCKTNIPDKNGYLPIHYACQYGHEEITKLLLGASDYCAAQNNNGETPLALASRYKHKNIVNLLNSYHNK